MVLIIIADLLVAVHIGALPGGSIANVRNIDLLRGDSDSQILLQAGDSDREIFSLSEFLGSTRRV